MWALVGAVPLSLALSNPAVFVAGGIGLGLAYPVWKHAKPAEPGCILDFWNRPYRSRSQYSTYSSLMARAPGPSTA